MLLTDENFLAMAMAAHRNLRHTTEEEFNRDLKIISSVARLLRRYSQSPEACNIRLLLNHTITLCNVFDIRSVVDLLFFRVDSSDHPQLKTILLFLDYLPLDNNYPTVGVDLNLAHTLNTI